MAKLLIRIKANLLVNEFIAELLNSFFRNRVAILCFKHHKNVFSICLLMNIEAVGKLIASSSKGLFCV